MPLPTVIPLNVMSGHFTLHQLVWRDDRSICGPLVRAVHFDVPLREAIDHLLQRRLVPSPPFPVEQLPRVAIQRFPAPEFAPLFLEIMPHLIELQDDRPPRGFWFLVI